MKKNTACEYLTYIEWGEVAHFKVYGTCYPTYCNTTFSDKLTTIQKLDKIIELLEEIADDKAEDELLVESGLLKRLVNEAKLTSSSSDWQKELDEL